MQQRFHNLNPFFYSFANITSSREAYNTRFIVCISTFRDVYVIKYVKKLHSYDMIEFCESLNIIKLRKTGNPHDISISLRCIVILNYINPNC